MRSFLASVLVAATAATAMSQTISVLMLEGDTVPGVGDLTITASVAVNDNGQWYAEWDTNNPATDTDTVLLTGFGVGPFGVALRENQPLPSPAGALLDSLDAVNVNNNGNSGWNFFLDGTTGSGDDSGIYFNTSLLIQEGAIATDPRLMGADYRGFFDAKINNGDQIFAMCTVDIPGVGTTADRTFVRIDNPGGVFTESSLIQEGDEPIPGRFVTDLGTGPHETAITDSASYMIAVDVDGDTTTNDLIMIDGVVIAQENDPSPEPNRVYATLTGTELDLNDAGDYVFSASLDGDTSSNLYIVKNGAKFVQEGDSRPGTGGFTFTSFGSGPIDLDDNGNVLWFGDWNNPDTSIDRGLFLNDSLIVQEGVTMVDVNGTMTPIAIVDGISEAYAISDNGQWVIFRGELPGSIDGVFLIEIPADCPEDINGDGVVDGVDLSTLLGNFGGPGAGDINGDGIVDGVDLSTLLGAFGTSCP